MAFLLSILLLFGAATVSHAAGNKNEVMVVSAHPLASDAGAAVLAGGGSAVDAAIAVQAMLTVVEPQSSGIGGGAFMLYWDNSKKKLFSFDGRETAPATPAKGAGEHDLFVKQGKLLSWRTAAVGGVGVGVPGVLAMLKLAHQRHGKHAWKDLFGDAIGTARNGFVVDHHLHKAITYEKTHGGLGNYAGARELYLPLRVGDTVKNPRLATSLTTIADKGIKPFYCGAIAKEIVARVRSATNPGTLTVDDMCGYRAKMRQPVCGGYRGYQVCGMGPPSSGGTTVYAILKLLERFDLSAMYKRGRAGRGHAYHLFTQASRLAYADRNLHLADSDFVAVPVASLIDERYLSKRSHEINPRKDMGNATSGIATTARLGQDRSHPSTTHFVIVDGAGNIVSMTSSVEKGFGSTLMAGGFMLNNQLTDFSFAARGDDGALIANRPQPGKRPRSSMSPTIIFDQAGAPRFALGSPGGSRIISYVAKAIIGLIDWRLSPAQAAALPHVVNANGATELEKNTPATGLASRFKRMGHQVVEKTLMSGLHIVALNPSGLEGGADPRRGGVAVKKTVAPAR